MEEGSQRDGCELNSIDEPPVVVEVYIVHHKRCMLIRTVKDWKHFIEKLEQVCVMGA